MTADSPTIAELEDRQRADYARGQRNFPRFDRYEPELEPGKYVLVRDKRDGTVQFYRYPYCVQLDEHHEFASTGSPVGKAMDDPAPAREPELEPELEPGDHGREADETGYRWL